MKIKLSFLLTIMFYAFGIAQSDYNMNFEIVDSRTHLPKDWSFTNPRVYQSNLDSIIVKDGKYSLSLSSKPESKGVPAGACTYVIPAKYAGETVELKGYLKTLDVTKDGFAGLWMRIDGESGYLAFDNMQKRNINGTNEWKEYTIRLPLDEGAVKIFVGGIIGGTGTIWIDNLRLFFDDQEIDEAPCKEVKVYKAQLDSAFYGGSKIKLLSVNETQIKNLSILGKVWGFLKYYHPQIAQGNFNWDFELFRILPKVIASKSRKERDNHLLEWIDKLGSVPLCDACQTQITGDHKQIPDLAWINNKNLEIPLKEKLDFIHKNRNQDKHYYISLTPGVGNPVFSHENPYKDLLYPDTGYRLLALFRYWNIIQYFSPYKYTIGEDWNSVLEELIPKFIHAKDALAYRLECLKMIGRTNDTHANIWGQDSVLSDYHGKYRLPVEVKFIEDQLVVTDYYDNDLGKKTGLNIGDIILSVDDVEVNDIVKNRLPFYPASNYSIKRRDIARTIFRGKHKKVTLELLKDNQKTVRIIQTIPTDSLDLRKFYTDQKPDSCYQFITEDIGYIYLGNIKSKLLPEIFERFKDTRGIVIDIRNYPSEFVVFALGKYLVPVPTEFVMFTKGDIHHPGLFHWTPALKVGEENPDYYKGKVIIIVNETTISSAEYHTMAFRTAPKAVVIGSTTAAADGNVSPFYLPGNIRTMITGIGVYYPDGQETQRVGILPDIVIKPTIRGIKEGRDELLEKAIEIINN